MNVATSRLIGPALDWAVGHALGIEARNNRVVYFVPHEAECDDHLEFVCMADSHAHATEQCEDAYPGCRVEDVEMLEPFSPSTNWAQAGPIIESERIMLTNGTPVSGSFTWYAFTSKPAPSASIKGATALEAAMRNFVAIKLGDEVHLPEGLLSASH